MLSKIIDDVWKYLGLWGWIFCNDQHQVKKRNCLTDEHLENLMRATVTEYQPQIKTIGSTMQAKNLTRDTKLICDWTFNDFIYNILSIELWRIYTCDCYCIIRINKVNNFSIQFIVFAFVFFGVALGFKSNLLVARGVQKVRQHCSRGTMPGAWNQKDCWKDSHRSLRSFKLWTTFKLYLIFPKSVMDYLNSSKLSILINSFNVQYNCSFNEQLYLC